MEPKPQFGGRRQSAFSLRIAFVLDLHIQRVHFVRRRSADSLPGRSTGKIGLESAASVRGVLAGEIVVSANAWPPLVERV